MRKFLSILVVAFLAFNVFADYTIDDIVYNVQQEYYLNLYTPFTEGYFYTLDDDNTTKNPIENNGTVSISEDNITFSNYGFPVFYYYFATNEQHTYTLNVSVDSLYFSNDKHDIAYSMQIMNDNDESTDAIVLGEKDVNRVLIDRFTVDTNEVIEKNFSFRFKIDEASYNSAPVDTYKTTVKVEVVTE